MKNDLHLTFGDIFNNDVDAFRDQLIEIQDFRTSRDESEEWVQHLRFLDISHVPLLDGLGDREPPSKSRRHRDGHRQGQVPRPARLSIPLTSKEDDNGSTEYIAVSWKWEERQTSSADQSFDYRIQRPGHKSHKSDFPDHYLERVVRFAQYVDIRNIWIDKECIYQRPEDDPADKRLGIQIMDVVYGSSAYSAGLLRIPIIEQAGLDALAALLSLSIFVKNSDTDNASFKDHVDTKAVEDVIRRLLSDPRWSRAWIFQEDHLASDRMILLIPCCETLKKGRQYDFGTIQNELLVRMHVFRRTVTMFCVAAGDDHLAAEFLVKAKQYNIWNKRTLTLQSEAHSSLSASHASALKAYKKGILRTDSNTAGIKTYPSTTLSILEDICSRNLEKEHDRIAILANAAKFPIRLDVGEQSPLIRPGAFSMSTALLALTLLNGEILKTDCTPPAEQVLKLTLQEYLAKWQYKFIAPGYKFEQSFIDHCRLNSPTLTLSGVHVEGFLFQLLPRLPAELNPLELTKQDKDNLSRLSRPPRATRSRRRRKLSVLNEEIIEILIERLHCTYGEDHGLADLLYHQLELDRNPPDPDEADPLTKYVLNIVSALAGAVLAGRDVRLARLEHESDLVTPSAMFIVPLTRDKWLAEELPDKTNHPPRVFVSWDKGYKDRGMERLASLEVAMDDMSTLKHVTPQSSTYTTSHDEKSNNSGSHANNITVGNGREEKGSISSSGAVLRSSGWVNGIWDTTGKRMNQYTFPLPGVCDIELEHQEYE